MGRRYYALQPNRGRVSVVEVTAFQETEADDDERWFASHHFGSEIQADLAEEHVNKMLEKGVTLTDFNRLFYLLKE